MKLRKWISPVVVLLVTVFVCAVILPSKADAATSSVIIVPSGFDGVYEADGTFHNGASLVEDVFPDGTYFDGTFTIAIRKGKTTITGLRVECNGVFEIPDTLGGYPVIALAEDFTEKCKVDTLVLPDTLTSIPDFAFTCCGITEIILPNTIKELGESAFANCKSLQHITIPDSITSVGWAGFEGCSGLKTVTLGKGLEYIDGCAFSKCTSLRAITIPAEITKIEEEAFYKCENLTDVFYYGTKSMWDEISIDDENDSLTQATIHFCDADGICTDCGATKLAIRNQPVSVSASVGKTAKVTVTVVGDGLTYRWYYKNYSQTKFSATTSFKSNAYWVEMDKSRANRQVYCVITDKYGDQVTTKTVMLSAKTTLRIKKQPKDVSVAGGKTAKVSVSVSGEGLTYQWYFKNAGEKKFSLTKSFKGSSYSVKMDASRAGRQVYCIVTDKKGNFVISDVATLKASLLITQEPFDTLGKTGGAVYTRVKAVGNGLTYKWYYKNKGAKKFSYTKSFTGEYYKIKMSDARAGRQVYCVVTDKYGNTVTSRIATLYAEPTISPAKPTAKNGSKIKLTVKQQGEGFTYRWQVKTPSGKWKDTTTTGCKTKTLTVSATKARNGYQYRCIVSDKLGGGAVSSAVTLKVK